MKKIIILTAITSILLVGGQQQAWAGNKSHQKDDDYRAFRKIVRILDTLINDDHRRGKKHVTVKKYSFPRRICYYKGPFEVCRFDRPGNRRYGYKQYHKKFSKRRYDKYPYYDRKYRDHR